MINNIAAILNKGLPIAASIKGISAADPRLRAFLYAAAAAGYTTDKILGFLNDVGMQSEEKRTRGQMAQREAQGVARPDELARLEQARQSEGIQQAASGLAGLAGGYAGGSMAGRLQAETSDAEPPDIKKPPPSPRSYVQIALEGANYLDLPKGIIPKVGPLVKRLNRLEEQGVPFKDASVKKLVKAIRKFTGIDAMESARSNLVEEERQRFQGGYGVGENSSSDQQLLAMLDQLSQTLNNFNE